MPWTGMPYRRRQCWLCPSTNVPQVPQVHQSCVRTDLSTERQSPHEPACGSCSACRRSPALIPDNPKAELLGEYANGHNRRCSVVLNLKTEMAFNSAPV